jgi:hypothetical protein
VGVLETLAYAISRGIIRGWLDVLRERETSVDEFVTDQDRLRAARMRDAIRLHSEAARDTKLQDPP